MALRNQSWLAITVGCCASSRDSLDDDEGRNALRANGETEMKICYDQPQTIQYPRAAPVHHRPTTSHSVSRHVSQWASNGRGLASRATSRASVYTLSRPGRSHSKPRPTIGRPMDFRHCEGADGIQNMLDDAPNPVRRRRSFSPLELSIYLPEGRLSPLPDFAETEWDKIQPTLEKPAEAVVRVRDSRTSSNFAEPAASSYLIQRKPVGSGSARMSMSSMAGSVALSSLPFQLEESDSRPESIISEQATLNRSSTRASQSSTSRLLARLPSPSRSRSNTASSGPASLRRAKTDIDAAIRELNTIVEERRASAYRSQTASPVPVHQHHVPAIAPSLRMHVRSETLSDIGSAFSVPLASKPSAPRAPILTRSTTAPFLSRKSAETTRGKTQIRLVPAAGAVTSGPGPLTSNPPSPPSANTSGPTTPIQRLGAWLKRSIPGSPPRPSPPSSTSTVATPFTTMASANPTTATTTTTVPPLPRPSTSTSTSHPPTSNSRSRSRSHTRHFSTSTANATLFSLSTVPSTPALSRSTSPDADRDYDADLDYMLSAHASPLTQTAARVTIQKAEIAKTSKTLHVPASSLELILKQTHAQIEGQGQCVSEKDNEVDMDVKVDVVDDSPPMLTTSPGEFIEQQEAKTPPTPAGPHFGLGLLKGLDYPVTMGGTARASVVSVGDVDVDVNGDLDRNGNVGVAL